MEEVESSPIAKAYITDYKIDEEMPHVKDGARAKYEIAYMSVGKSYRWPYEAKLYNAIRQFAFQWNKKNEGKHLKVIRHKEYNCIELARIA